MAFHAWAWQDPGRGGGHETGRKRRAGPAREIEQRVQARAKDIALDMGRPEGAARLRALIDDEAAAWSDDFRRGRRDFDLSEPAAVAERAFRNLAGYGPLEPLLTDDDVWEIMINSPTSVFVKRHRGRSGSPQRIPRATPAIVLGA